MFDLLIQLPLLLIFPGAFSDAAGVACLVATLISQRFAAPSSSALPVAANESRERRSPGATRS
jgi:hypothetical protein